MNIKLCYEYMWILFWKLCNMFKFYALNFEFQNLTKEIEIPYLPRMPPLPPTPAEPPRHTPGAEAVALRKLRVYCYYLFLLLIVSSITMLFFVLTRRIGGLFLWRGYGPVCKFGIVCNRVVVWGIA